LGGKFSKKQQDIGRQGNSRFGVVHIDIERNGEEVE
jgi:hypothetical protein